MTQRKLLVHWHEEDSTDHGPREHSHPGAAGSWVVSIRTLMAYTASTFSNSTRPSSTSASTCRALLLRLLTQRIISSATSPLELPFLNSKATKSTRCSNRPTTPSAGFPATHTGTQQAPTTTICLYRLLWEDMISRASNHTNTTLR